MRTYQSLFAHIRVYLFGGTAYGLIELLWRGHTHWSMVLTGGLVFHLLLCVNHLIPNTPLLLRCGIGSFFISAIELIVGCLVNLWLQLDVWDYSQNSLNLLGQICLRYTCYWFLLCIPIFLACPFLERCFYPKKHSKGILYGKT